MGRTVNIGAQGFENLRINNDFYVDKTNFIKEWWESRNDISLITRPRRFGKTLNMNMLECFFSNKYAGRSDLFEGLSIWEEEKYREMQGTWPVIFLTFADIKQVTFKSTMIRIKENIYDLYRHHRYLLEGDSLTDDEKEQFSSVKYDMPDEVAETAIRKLMEYMSKYHGKKVIFLLDEYDTPMQEAWVSGFWDEMVVFIRSMFNATFKTNPYLERAVMTGITRVSKESIFSDLNNLKVVTTTSDKYGDCFGFTEEEVFASLDEMDLSDMKDAVKAWYDGFTFGKHKDIYNPWSITNFLDERKLDTYWADSSSNALVSNVIQQGDPEIKEIMEDLLAGKTLKCEIDEQIIFNQLSGKKESIWSLLLASGYLKVVDFATITGRSHRVEYMYELALTNLEVQIMFEDLILDWFADGSSNYNNFVKALLAGNLEEMNHYMNRVALNIISNFDSGTHPSDDSESEKFYHGLVLGLIVDLQDRYVVTSNRESGFGRYDIMIEPLNTNDLAFILEFKVFNPKREKTLEDTVAAALQQIEDKKYETQLIAHGIAAENIRKYGFAFKVSPGTVLIDTVVTGDGSD